MAVASVNVLKRFILQWLNILLQELPARIRSPDPLNLFKDTVRMKTTGL